MERAADAGKKGQDNRPVFTRARAKKVIVSEAEVTVADESG